MNAPAACSSDLTSAEALLRAVLDGVTDEIAVVTMDGTLVDANRTLLARLGKPREEVLGQCCCDMFGLCQGDTSIMGEGAEIWKTGKPVETNQTITDASGHAFIHKILWHPLEDAKGERRVLVIARDITARTAMEMQLAVTERLAAIGELSTYLAHEIRNPLFAIAGFANALLRLEDLPDRARTKAEVIIDESNRLDSILKSLLDFARPTDAGKGEADLGKLAEETLSILSLSLQSLAVDTTFEVQPGLPRARVEPNLAKQCLVNVVKNAIEAMPDGGDLEVKVYVNGPRVEVFVRDTGVGIEPDVIPKLFSPFYTTKNQGHGLGLAQVKKIVDECGGAISIKSTSGQGTSVTLSFAAVTGQA